MHHFSEMPEAVDFVAYQSWLSPDERPISRSRVAPAAGQERHLRPREAWRKIRQILRRTSFRQASV